MLLLLPNTLRIALNCDIHSVPFIKWGSEATCIPPSPSHQIPLFHYLEIERSGHCARHDVPDVAPRVSETLRRPAISYYLPSLLFLSFSLPSLPLPTLQFYVPSVPLRYSPRPFSSFSLRCHFTLALFIFTSCLLYLLRSSPSLLSLFHFSQPLSPFQSPLHFPLLSLLVLAFSISLPLNLRFLSSSFPPSNPLSFTLSFSKSYLPILVLYHLPALTPLFPYLSHFLPTFPLPISPIPLPLSTIPLSTSSSHLVSTPTPLCASPSLHLPSLLVSTPAPSLHLPLSPCLHSHPLSPPPLLCLPPHPSSPPLFSPNPSSVSPPHPPSIVGVVLGQPLRTRLEGTAEGVVGHLAVVLLHVLVKHLLLLGQTAVPHRNLEGK
ncbi:hypothetical protein C7M84_011362 [Penaeus vannamei]|uniref:Uncharacterized protein n=1 Tax=Penaeus vannamei TaxID=6689 RepID=A0A3R7PFT1_PENVA|nr:hypothetical protein C7M84_011362 [Penaeus vannamei]